MDLGVDGGHKLRVVVVGNKIQLGPHDDRDWVRWYQQQNEVQVWGQGDSFHLGCDGLEGDLNRAEVETLLAELRRADNDNFLMHHEDLPDLAEDPAEKEEV
jgi:hypothetical protein